MPIQILMPALSPTMEEGTLAKWLVKEGDTVSSGDLLAEIETDKATMEFEAVDEGVIGKILIPEGAENVAVNTPIAVLLAEGETLSDVADAPAIEQAQATQSAKPSVVVAPVVAVAPQTSQESQGTRVFASPLARRLAATENVDLATLQGTGPRGRIIKVDVQAAAAQPRPVQAASVLPSVSSSVAAVAAPSLSGNIFTTETLCKMYENRSYEEISLDGMRRTIASRLTQAKQTIPHFYLRRDICLDALLAFRSQLNTNLAERKIKLSVNDFIIKACALALQDVPEANAVWANDRVLQMKPSDVAVAVAVDGGLFTPVLQDAEKKTLSALSFEMKDLAARARNKKLAPHEYQGGSFAISNLGMFGVENFDAVINPPHGAILAVGAGIKKPVVAEDGQITTATMMSCTLSVDHRVIDGAVGARLLAAIVDHLENPLGMLA